MVTFYKTLMAYKLQGFKLCSQSLFFRAQTWGSYELLLFSPNLSTKHGNPKWESWWALKLYNFGIWSFCKKWLDLKILFWVPNYGVWSFQSSLSALTSSNSHPLSMTTQLKQDHSFMLKLQDHMLITHEVLHPTSLSNTLTKSYTTLTSHHMFSWCFSQVNAF